MPLSLGGKCEGETIRCPYHGLEFSPTGACVGTPSRAAIPKGAKVVAYPVVEKDAMIWVWVGNPDRADPELVIDYPYHSSPDWDFATTKFQFNASYDLVIDNILDLTHVAFVHKAVLQADMQTQVAVETQVRRRGDRGLSTARHMPNSVPPLQYQRPVPFKGMIDRWQETEFRPGIIDVYSGGMDAGNGAFTGNRVGGVHLRTVHAITPVTSTSCTYHFSIAKNFSLGDPELLQALLGGGIATVTEDIAILEAQQMRITEAGEDGFVSLASDAAQLQARRIHRALIRAQDEAAPATSAADIPSGTSRAREQPSGTLTT
jgi:vanillate O-demethylase monooxygenase subunit